MTKPTCPACTLEDVLSHPDHWECATCGHVEGDTVALIKDLKLGGGSQVLKSGTKAKNIRLVDGDHEIACKIDGASMALKACFVKKV
jgi:protein PhnA